MQSLFNRAIRLTGVVLVLVFTSSLAWADPAPIMMHYVIHNLNRLIPGGIVSHGSFVLKTKTMSGIKLWTMHKSADGKIHRTGYTMEVVPGTGIFRVVYFHAIVPTKGIGAYGLPVTNQKFLSITDDEPMNIDRGNLTMTGGYGISVTIGKLP